MVVLVVVQRRWKYPWSGAPGAVTVPLPVKSSPGHAWLATRALPRHASQVSTWALVSATASLLSSPTFYSTTATALGHFGHA
jgi:hypothetical protein